MIDQQMTHRGIFTASRMCLFIVGHVVITSNFWFNVAQRMGKLYHENVIITGVHTLNIGDDKCVSMRAERPRLLLFTDFCFVRFLWHVFCRRRRPHNVATEQIGRRFRLRSVRKINRSLSPSARIAPVSPNPFRVPPFWTRSVNLHPR